MIIRFFDWLRNQPMFVVKQVVFGISLFITVVITGVWTTTLPATFSNLNVGPQVAQVIDENKSAVTDMKDVVNAAREYRDVAGGEFEASFEGTRAPEGVPVIVETFKDHSKDTGTVIVATTTTYEN